MRSEYRRLRLACYTGNICMAIVGNLPPLLFLTFRASYGISYGLLGTLVLVNFCTQLCVDLLFSFFSHKFNIPKTVRLMPLVAIVGFVIFALAPLFKGNEYLALLVGTVVFSFASGLAEVLLSPIIAAIPSKDPDREMSKLHSIYAWGAVAVIVISSLFLYFVGQSYWQLIVFALLVVPFTSFLLFMGAQIPEMQSPDRTLNVSAHLKNKTLWISVAAIFLGGVAECTMAQWASGFLEGALGIDKIWGDLLGVAMFALMLGLGRTVYSKIGKNLEAVLLLGVVGATACYFLATFSSNPAVCLIACAMTGLCTSMLWPGNLSVASARIPDGGVFLFALMAAGGDLGASFGPQMMGAVTDAVAASPYMNDLAASLGLSAEQLGMKVGMGISALLALISVPIFLYIFLSARARKDKKQ